MKDEYQPIEAQAPNALIVDGNLQRGRALSGALAAAGWRAERVRESADARELIGSRPWALLVFAARRRGKAREREIAARMIQEYKARYGSNLHTIVVAEVPEVDGALTKLLGEADDYVVDGYDAEWVVARADVRRVRNQALRREAGQGLMLSPGGGAEEELVGASREWVAIERMIGALAARDQCLAERNPRVRPPAVLICGESGTGKELVARKFKESGGRSSRPFVSVNCATMTPELADSALYGHVRGAFTGATGSHKGFFESADGGTLFLDEVTELPLPVQAKLLRALQEGEITPVGSTAPRAVDIQIISATNKRIIEEVTAGRFREDLYYRLNTHELTLPPLRERTSDVARLVGHFGRRYVTRVVLWSSAALDLMMQYPWPGNVRELNSVVRAAITKSPDEYVLTVDLPEKIRNRVNQLVRATGGRAGELSEWGVPAPDAGAAAHYESAESLAREMIGGNAVSAGNLFFHQSKSLRMTAIEWALAATGGNVAAAARLLNTSRQNLYQIRRRQNQARRRPCPASQSGEGEA